MPNIDLVCTACNKPFSIPPKNYNFRVKRGQINFYCSVKCAAARSAINRIKEPYFCKKCNNIIGYGYKFSTRTFCKECSPYKNHNNRTLGEFAQMYALMQYHNKLRGMARSVIKRVQNLRNARFVDI